MIPKNTIDEIFETVKIEEVVGDFVSLKKRGVNLLGLCPFHNEKTPSFTVSPAKGIYKCFGCGEGGNSVSFLMDKEHYSYPEALKYLAKKYNIEIIEEELTAEQTEMANEKDSLYILSTYAKNFFAEKLWDTDEGKSVGLNYFSERGYTNEIIKKFELGYSPKKKDVFTQTALKSSYSEDYIIKSGLGFNIENQGTIDRFRERVMFPIHSFSGRILGFGGRALNPNAKAKYQNSPESLIYNKSKILYGIFFAKNAISKKNNCYIVEGYTDVISLHQKGIENVVSASGTSLTLDQIKLINRFTKNITILFDGDAAGVKASFRGVDMILKEGMNVKVVPFPENEDPDSYAQKKSSEEFASFLNNYSTDFITYKTKILNTESEQDPIKRVAIIKDIIQSISLIPDYLTRTEYCKVCSKLLDVKESVLLRDIDQQRKQISTKLISQDIVVKEKPKRFSNNVKLKKYEEEIIRIILNYGNEIIFFEEDKVSVAEFITNELMSDKIKINNAPHDEIYNAITNIVISQKKINQAYFISHANTEINKLCIDLLSNQHAISDNWALKHKIYTGRENQNLRKTAEKAVLSLKLQHVEDKIQIIQKKIQQNTSATQELNILKNLIMIKNQISLKIGRSSS
jgi:DNA primase